MRRLYEASFPRKRESSLLLLDSGSRPAALPGMTAAGFLLVYHSSRHNPPYKTPTVFDSELRTGFYNRLNTPPSIQIVCPVIKPVVSDARYTIASLISCGWANRLFGI